MSARAVELEHKRETEREDPGVRTLQNSQPISLAMCRHLLYTPVGPPTSFAAEPSSSREAAIGLGGAHDCPRSAPAAL